MGFDRRRRIDGPTSIAVAILAIGALAALWVQLVNPAGNGRDDVDLLDELDPSQQIDDHVLWAIELVNGPAPSEDQVLARMSPAFAAEVRPSEALSTIELLRQFRPYTVEGVLERDGGDELVVRAAAGDGTLLKLFVVEAPDDPARLAGLGFLFYEPTDRTHSSLQLAAGLLAAAALVAAALLTDVGATRWALLSAAGLWLLQFAEEAGSAVPYSAAIILPWAAIGIVLVTALGRDPIDQGRLAAVARPAVAGGMALLAGAAPVIGIQTGQAGAPRNLLAADTTLETAARLADLRAALAVVTLLVVVVLVAVVLVLAVPIDRSRRTNRQALATMFVMVLVLALGGLSWFVGPGWFDLTPSPMVSGALLVGGAGLAWGSLGDHLRAGGVAQLAVDLGQDPGGTSIEASLRRALNDPTLELIIWPPEDSRTEMPTPETQPADKARTTTQLELDGEPLGMLIHDRHHRPQQVRAACSAVGLAIRNARLEAEVRKQLDEVRASRSRLLTATDDARRSLERDLHDGVQQRILSAMVEVQRAKRRLRDQPAAEEALDVATRQLETTLQEVRDIARGLRPGSMDRGLVPAVRDLADRFPLPITVRGSRTRSEPGVEHAAWFVISEALTNAARHADATSIDVSIDAGDNGVSVTVTDDGRGGAEVVRGGGLEGIVDRVEALGGTVALKSSNGEGTTISLFLPANAGPDDGPQVDTGRSA